MGLVAKHSRHARGVVMRTMRAVAGVPAAADWVAIGTQVRLVVTNPARLEDGRQMLVHDLAELDLACSPFRAESELAIAERAAPGPVHVSPVLADSVGTALLAADMTGGDLDPIVATSVAAPGHAGDLDVMSNQGTPVQLTVRNRSPWQQIRLDRAASVMTMPAGVRLDLSPTAQARAADRAAARIAEQLNCGALVGLGGDIAVDGQPPEGGWRVRVQDVAGHPDDPASGHAALITMRAGGIATAGTARRWRGPAAPVWQTVSVMAGTALHASIASMAAVIRGHGAPGWLEGLGVPARLVAADGAVRTTLGWPADPAACAA